MAKSDRLHDVADAIARHERAVIASHVRPDGDSLGSSLALRAILESRGISSKVVIEDEVPRRYRFLPGSEEVVSCERACDSEGAVCIVLDTTSPERMGRTEPLAARAATTVVIDHHPENSFHQAVVWTDDEASSVGEMIWRLAAGVGWKVPAPACECIYTAILTDTGRFSFSNTSPTALRIASEAVAGGADPERIAFNVYGSKTQGQWRLEALARSSLRLDALGRIATMSLALRDFTETGTTPLDAHEFASLPRTLAGVEVGLFLHETEDATATRVNVRTGASVDASALAGLFGGGGHRRAAGCTIDGGLESARGRVVEAASGFLTER